MNDSIFKELKQEAIKIWQTYDNTYGYADEKINYINSFRYVSEGSASAWCATPPPHDLL